MTTNASTATSRELRAVMPQAVMSLFLGNAEPTLDDLMEDDVVATMMARDGVARQDLLGLLDRMRGHLR